MSDNSLPPKQLRAMIRRGIIAIGACIALGAGVGALLMYAASHRRL
jgi:hypothetical protein